MRILHTVEFYHPSVGGMQEVVRQLSERLARRGHAVTVATSWMPQRMQTAINGVEIEAFAVQGNRARGLTGEVDRYKAFLRGARFDVMTNFSAPNWATDIALPLLDDLPMAKVFVPTGFSGLRDPVYRDYFAAMGTWMQRYDMNVFLSERYRDIEFARQAGVRHRILIPNGAGADEFLTAPAIDIRAHLGILPTDLLVLHVGSHTRFKGHAEAIRIFGEADLRNATLLMVANTLSRRCAATCAVQSRLFNAAPARRHDHKKIIITSLPRAETLAAYHAADIFLFPSNIECSPIVLFESMASRTPFLTTDVGNAAEIIAWSGGGRLLPTDTDAQGYGRARIAPSAAMLTELYRHPDQRVALAESGFNAWRQRFTWEHITTQYEQLYLDLARRRAESPPALVKGS